MLFMEFQESDHCIGHGSSSLQAGWDGLGKSLRSYFLNRDIYVLGLTFPIANTQHSFHLFAIENNGDLCLSFQ